MNRTFLLAAAVVACIGAAAITSCENVGLDSPKESEPRTPPAPLLRGTTIMYTGDEDHSISMPAAEEMIAAFQAANPFETYGWYFGRVAMEQLLAQSGAVGLRIYGGFKPDGHFSPVIFGVNGQGKDINRGGLSKSPIDSVGVAEMSFPCPPC